MRAGRPTKYKVEYIEAVDEYLKERRDKRVRYVVQKRTGDKPYTTYEQRVKVKLPSTEGFADYIGVTRMTLYNWGEENPDFKDALEKIKTEQLKRLIDEGLAGTYNSTIAKLMLSHNHNMREKSDITTDDEPLNNFSDDQIDRIAERVAKRRRSDGNTPGKEELN